MDPSDFRPSPRREIALQGPRPSPLRVSKESHTIKKPPVAPQARPNTKPAPAPAQPQPEQQPQPLIIYAVSPKVIYTKASNFMTLVQRLTGPNSTTETSVSDLSLPSPASATGALSPAARIASFEKSSPTVSPYINYNYAEQNFADAVPVDEFQITDVGVNYDRPGILSPLPSSLPPISQAMFSPNFDTSMLGFMPELSPGTVNNNYSNSCGVANNSNMGYWDGGNLLPSPGNSFLMSPLMASPGALGEFFSQFPDFL